MDGDAAPEEVPQVQEEVLEVIGPHAEDAEDESQQKTPNSKKSKGRKHDFKKVTNLSDFYAPAPYTSATKGGGRGKGPKGSGKGEGEEGRKGKGKGAYNYQEGEAAAKPADDVAQSPPSVAPGPVAVDGDASQAKGGAGAKKRGQMGKDRGGGAGGAGGGGAPGGGGGGKGGKGRGDGGKAQQAPRKGGQGKGGPRGPMQPNEMLDAGPEAEGPRTPGPQQRPPVAVKGAAPSMAMVMPGLGAGGMSYGGMPGYPFAGQMGMPMGMGGMPGMGGMGAGAMYALPYYVMPSPNMGAQQPFGMPAAPPPLAQPPPVLNAADRATLTSSVQKQIEYYFGMENLLKDVFLRKHMTDEGWVPIALLAGFRRIQTMTSDTSVLMEAITTSQLVEINPQSTHIRLRNEWPRWILAPQKPGAAPAPAAAPPPQPAIRSTP